MELPAPNPFKVRVGGREFWEAKWQWNGKQVKRRIGPAKGVTVHEARRLAADLVRAYADDAQPLATHTDEMLTFERLADAYLDWAEHTAEHKPSTIRDHRSTLKPAREAFGQKLAPAVKTEDVEKLLTERRREGVSNRTVNKLRAVISACYSYGRKKHRLTTNPATYADRRPQPERQELEYYSVEEIEKIAAACKPQDAEAVRIAAYSGLRQGELLELRGKDVDHEARVIHVRRALSAGTPGPPKSGKRRDVTLTDRAAAAFERLGERQGDALWFVGKGGDHIDGTMLTKRYKAAACEALGAERVLTFHKLRHTYGSLLAANPDIAPLAIQKELGHARLETTSIYLHQRRDETHRAAVNAALS